MPHLRFDSVSYSTGGRQILKELSFSLEAGEVLVLLGRSGSGKTTALRLINRLLEATGGTVELYGRNVAELDPVELRRSIGYVIQEFGLLPHWSVGRNVGLVPELLGWPLARRQERSRELLAQVGLADESIFERLPQELSGGQRQRVAVARALAAQPSLLLFDEPFGALDPVTRSAMQQQFLALKEQYGFAAVFVTHDLLEALTIGTRIAVLDSGSLEVMASPQEFPQVKTPTARAFLDTLPPDCRPQ